MNSTWFEATNSVLNLAQLPLITTTANFNGGQLTKYQNAAKYKIDLGHRHLTLNMVTAFTNRKFPLPIQQGTTDYILDTGISAESLKYHSWYNITAGNPYAGHLPLIKYEDYMNWWPDQTQVQSGPPQYVVQLPYDSQLDIPNPSPRIRIYPVPDNQYTLQYQARLNPYHLTDADSPIIFPPEYEHGLWTWAWKYLEVDLSEGREASLQAIVDEVVNRIHVVSMVAEEVRVGVRLPKLSGRGYGGYSRSYFG